MSKGITPVIAVILLLLITIAIVGFAFTFFQRTTQTTAQAGQTQLASQINQTSIRFVVENVDKNNVYIRNLGTNSIILSSLAFYVNDQSVEAAGPASLAQNAVGQYFLNDSKLAMLPDPAALRVTSGITSDTWINTCFYCNYYAGYWKFDEGSGTTAQDSSGKANTGTLVNGPVWVSGKYGSALSFDGTDDYVDMSYAPSLPTSSDLTFESWVMPTASLLGAVVAQGDGNDFTSAYQIRLQGSSSPAYFVLGSGTSGTYVNFQLTPNVWNHVAATVSGTTIKVYVNGILAGTNSFTGTRQSPITPLHIGRRSDGFYFNGAIDNVRILNIARSMTTS